ncbi:MAG: PP2C family protein-serine/threonine phosphatase [Saezia sp.]
MEQLVNSETQKLNGHRKDIYANATPDSSLTFAAGIGLHKGDRPYQQDQVILIPHHYTKGCFLGMVADGMGGKTGGRTASNQAVQTAKQLFSSFDPYKDDPDLFLRQLANETHLIVRLTSVTSEEEPHTTFAAFLVTPNDYAYISHCGDSRVYLFNNKELVYRTHDHSYVQGLIDANKITEQEAMNHPKANLITSCLGIFMDQGPSISQYKSPKLKKGFVLMACSDGLWASVTSEEITWAINNLPPKEACENLVRKAYRNANGHSDNISIVIVKMDVK